MLLIVLLSVANRGFNSEYSVFEALSLLNSVNNTREFRLIGNCPEIHSIHIASRRTLPGCSPLDAFLELCKILGLGMLLAVHWTGNNSWQIEHPVGFLLLPQESRYIILAFPLHKHSIFEKNFVFFWLSFLGTSSTSIGVTGHVNYSSSPVLVL